MGFKGMQDGKCRGCLLSWSWNLHHLSSEYFSYLTPSLLGSPCPLPSIKLVLSPHSLLCCSLKIVLLALHPISGRLLFDRPWSSSLSTFLCSLTSHLLFSPFFEPRLRLSVHTPTHSPPALQTRMSSFTPINAPKRSNDISASARLPTRFRSRKKANSPRRPTLRWDQLKRYVLCCIFRFFLCDGWQTSKIFSHMFRSHLAERHFQSDVGYKCLHAQWRDMGRKKNADYIHVYNATFEPGSEIGDLIKQIRAAAAFLKIKLREKRLLQLVPTRAQDDREDLPVRCLKLGPKVYANTALRTRILLVLNRHCPIFRTYADMPYQPGHV